MIKRFVCYLVSVIRENNHQNQSGRIGGEVLVHANDSVKGNMTKFKGGVMEMTKRTAIRFCKLKDLAYFFKLRNRTNVCPQHKKSFTLIELLVVIAIISMLAAFLLPVITKVRAKAKYARWQTYSHTLEADTGLVAYYNFQEGSGTTLYNRASGLDIRGYDQEALDGTLVGGAQQWTTTNSRWPGKGAIEFDGSSDYVNCGNDSALNITDAITIEVWVKKSANPSNCSYIFDKGYKYFFRFSSSGTLTFYFNAGGVYDPAPASGVLANDTWYHIVGTYDKDGGSDNAQLYVNGKVVSQKTRTGTINTNSDRLTIGSGFSTPVNTAFNGTIDEVAIYSSALSDKEIENHYQMGKP